MHEEQPIQSRYDAVIVGARCAGASTAMLLARAGAKVLVVDRQLYGTDTVSTHAMMRAGVVQLDRWGVLDRVMAEGTPRIEETTFYYGAESVRVAIKPEHGVTHLCAPRRTVLDRVLVDTAAESGAEVRHGVSLVDLRIAADARVIGVTLKDSNGDVVEVDTDIVIGADGRQSLVAKLVGAEIYVEGTGASGYVYGYFENMPGDGYHWYFEKDVAAGVIPTNDGHRCVFAGVHQDRFAEIFKGDLDGGFLKIAAANSPALRDHLENARMVGRLCGFSGGVGYMRRPHGPGWALVGDAGYFKDPLTAHGITDALRDAELVSRAVLDGRAGSFVDFQDVRDTLSRPLLDVTDTIATFDWTLDEVQDHHVRLAQAMSAEADHVAEFSKIDVAAA